MPDRRRRRPRGRADRERTVARPPAWRWCPCLCEPSACHVTSAPAGPAKGATRLPKQPQVRINARPRLVRRSYAPFASSRKMPELIDRGNSGRNYDRERALASVERRSLHTAAADDARARPGEVTVWLHDDTVVRERAREIQDRVRPGVAQDPTPTGPA